MQRDDLLKILLLILALWVVIVAVPLSPQPVELQEIGAQIDRTNKHDASANAQQYLQALQFQPWRDEFLLEAGRLELTAGNWAQGIAHLEQFEVRHGLSPEDLILLGDAYSQIGQIEQSKKHWMEAVSGEVEAAGIFQEVYDRQMQAKDISAARNVVDAWYDQDTASPQALFLKGLFHLVDDPNLSLALINQASQVDKAYLSRTLFLNEAVQAPGETFEPGIWQTMIGRAYGSIGEWLLAEEAFTLAVQSLPNYAEAWALLGQSQLQVGKDGLPALQRAETINPESVITRAALGLYWRERGDGESALRYFLPLAEQYGDQCIWQVELGRTYSVLGQYEQAMVSFERGVKTQPDNADCWRELAIFSITQQIDIEAVGLPAARQVLNIAPDTPSANDLMGWALLAQDDFTNAEKFFQKSLEIDENYAPAHLHYAQLYLLRGIEPELGRVHLQRVIESDPRSSYADAAREMLKEYYQP